MKSNLCQLSRKRLSPTATIVCALILAALMIFADADQTTCLIALVLLISWAEPSQSCRRIRRDET